VCGQTIRKNQFQPQIFENLEVQKEVAVRKRTAKMCVPVSRSPRPPLSLAADCKCLVEVQHD